MRTIIQQELRAAHPELELIVLIGSVRDKQRVRDIFSKYRPELVFSCSGAQTRSFDGNKSE